MHILLLFPVFWPDELGGCALYSDLARYLKERGHRVTVVTSFPFYPRWQYYPQDRGVAYRVEDWEGITIHRVRMYIPQQPSGVKRILSDLSFLFNIGRTIPWTELRPTVALTAYPTLGTCLAFRLWLGHTPRMLMIQDFVVDAALELGMLKVPLLAQILPLVERWALGHFNAVSSISPQMVTRAKQKVPSPCPVLELPNWIHASLQMGIDRYRDQVVRQWQTQTITYSGNLGVKQGLGDFLEIFRDHHQGWTLIIRGEGAAKRDLAQWFQPGPRVQLADLLEEDAYCQSLLEMPLMLITQKAGSGASFLPSKLLSALVAGVPVLAFCELGTPLAQEIIAGGYGWVVSDQKGLAHVLKTITIADLQQKSVHARLRAEQYSRERILSQYEKVLTKLAQKSM
ncbi:glycosyltransferase [Candidatus Cyanaurora vandensis]|uniref:glycosyltransferase n=1 Tax=Candidatus Cyanaurora vandensis TaxID=2714958 RepID=UPI00257B3E95|nr:glycosyltransferase [Candidatus Cyanaurora vandensis]